MSKKMNALDKTASTLLTIGGLNWGWIAVGKLTGTSYNFVDSISSAVGITSLPTFVYASVGVSAVYVAGRYLMHKLG